MTYINFLLTKTDHLNHTLKFICFHDIGDYHSIELTFIYLINIFEMSGAINIDYLSISSSLGEIVFPMIRSSGMRYGRIESNIEGVMDRLQSCLSMVILLVILIGQQNSPREIFTQSLQGNIFHGMRRIFKYILMWRNLGYTKWQHTHQSSHVLRQ